jgi:hypothetical protein
MRPCSNPSHEPAQPVVATGVVHGLCVCVHGLHVDVSASLAVVIGPPRSSRIVSAASFFDFFFRRKTASLF